MDQQTTPTHPKLNLGSILPKLKRVLANKWLLAGLGAIGVAAIVILAVIILKIPLFGRLGVDVAFAEGTVEYRLSDADGWKSVPGDLSLGEGAQVRTLADSRAVLNIDDGSAVRLNSDSSVVLKKLTAKHIVVENTGGDVYTRVVKSETRKFEVVSGQTVYRSEGTGYRTIKTEKREGVEVYHSKVTILGLSENGSVVVEQGKRYYRVNTDKPADEGKVVELSVDEVAADSFMQWNSDEDKKEFENELGILFDLKPPALEVSAPTEGLTTESDNTPVKGTTEAGAKVLINGTDVANNNGVFETAIGLNLGANAVKVEAIDGAGNKTVKTLTVTRNAPAAPAPAPVSSKSFVLYGTAVDKGISFSWNVSGYTLGKGFKLVKSTKANPTYPGSEAQFIDSSQRSYTWKIKDGKTYNFRICIYDGSGCTVYSNNIAVTAPVYTDPQPTGSLSLSHTGGSSVSWQISGGTAYYGYKLVWATSGSPTYPGSSATFYDKSVSSGSITSTPGTYYVRVCMYYNGSCLNYSNQIAVIIP